MTIAFLFWLLMILWLVNLTAWKGATSFWAGHILLFVLLFLLGWKLFGFPIQG